MDVELTYRKGLLRSIGDVDVVYGPREWLDSTPRALGSWPLEYQRFGATLRSVAGIEITYRRWSALPVSVGRWSCEHTRFGNRLVRLGPYDLTHDRGGSRVRTIGPLEIFYDRLGSRPVRVRRHDANDDLSPDLLLALWVTLFWQHQSWEAGQRAARS